MKFDSKQKFSIRKYSIGAASVLIGTLIVGGTSLARTAQADELNDASSASSSSTANQETTADLVETSSTGTSTVATSPNDGVVTTPTLTDKAETNASSSATSSEVATSEVASASPINASEGVSSESASVKKTSSEEVAKASVATSTLNIQLKETESPVPAVEASTVARATTETELAKTTDDEVTNLPKVSKLKTEAAVAHDKGGVVVPLAESARAEYKSSLEAYMAMRRKNGNHRGTGFRNAGAVATDGDAEYEYKKVMTPVLPGYYADKASIAALVVTPENIGDLNFDVWYKKLGYIVYVDDQGNFVSPQGEVVSSRDSAAKQIYANDPSDPTRAWTTKVPSVPIGWELSDKQTAYGYNAEKGTVNPNQEKDQDAIGRDTAIVIRKQVQKAIVKYVNEKGNVELSRDAVVGKSGEAIDYSTNARISEYRRKGYELVSDGFTSASNKNFDFDASVDQEFTVTLRERIEPIDPDKPTPTPDKPVDPKDPDTPKWPDPVKDVVNKDDVTRTIHYVYEDGTKAKDDVAETLHFKRFAYVNLVTGHIDYRDWTTSDDTFDAVTSPVIKGYTADKAVVSEVRGVKAGAADVTEVVTYVKDAQKAVIKYVNEKGNVLLTKDEVAGKSGEAIDYSTNARISEYRRKGYELVSDGFTSASNKNFDFDASVDQEFTVTLRERIEPIDPDKPTPTPDKPVDPKDPDTPKWPDPVKDVVNKDDVTRTIHYVYEDGTKAKDDVAETLHFKRFAYVNLVTGHIDYRDWTTSDDTFDAVTSPVIKGYTADKAVVSEVRGVKAGAADVTEVVTYVKDAQKAVIKYVNEKGNVLLTKDEVAGKSGEAIDYSTNARISEYRRKGYELVSDGFTSASNKNFDFDASVDQEFTVTLRERIEPIDPDKPTPTPDKPVDPKDPDTPKWPDPVKDVVNKDDVTRTIHYVYEDGTKAKDDVAETLHFKRFAYVNLVTGHIDYRDWTTSDDTFDAVTSPVIKGYTADKAVVSEVRGVKAGAADVTEVVTYVKDAQKAVIKYVNEKGNVLLTKDEVAGKSGEAIDYSTNARISEYRRKGYELVSDGFTSASNKNFDFDASVDQEFTVTLRERIEPIDPDKPTPTPDKPVDPKDPDTPKWPDPVKDVVNKDDVTRTIHYVYEDGTKAKDDVAETLHFKRFAYVNLVTGHIDYRDWTTSDDTFDAVTSPVIKGYTADKAVVSEVRGVKAGAADVTEVVTYVKDAQKAVIKYVNEKGNVLLTKDEVAGKSGEAIDYSTNARISEYRRKGYELVSDGFTSASNKNFDFDASVDQEFTVTLRERIEPIDPDKPTPTPDQPVDPKDPDTPKWPDPVKDVVNKDDVTRTIHYVYEDGTKAKDDVAETLHFKRFTYVNLVTGHIDYRDWTTSDDTFDAVTSPVIKGYTADKAVVSEVRGVKAGAADVTEVVTYVKDAQKAVIKYVNEKGNVEVDRDTVNGKSGEVIAYSTANKINELHRKGYELVSDGFTSASNKNFDFDAKVDQEFTVVIRERVVPVGPEDPNPTPDTPYDPTDPNTPNWPKSVEKIAVRVLNGTRTVRYFDQETGKMVLSPVKEAVVFHRTVLVNLVTGEMTPKPWIFISATPIPVANNTNTAISTNSGTTRLTNAYSVEPTSLESSALAPKVTVNEDGTVVLPKVSSPVVEGMYTLVKEVNATTFNPESDKLDYNYNVPYKHLGHIEFVDLDGNPIKDENGKPISVVYKNDPSDSSRAVRTDLPPIPKGYTLMGIKTISGTYDAETNTVDPNNAGDPDAIGKNTTFILVKNPEPETPVKPVKPAIPMEPTKPETPVSTKPAQREALLPETGSEKDNATVAGVSSILLGLGLGLAGKRKKED
ncbi:MucBP domain-containing protein [Streptococcus salivarius]|uniref:MucBP domain-containing protein n=1 Tax=Streptococcus salivarius TaxID=1304 RepID=A0A7L6WKR6_STRSL|nr:MucBP domain-containing protein [Streptococcus salivarius]QMI51355.1 MucBP domain-containing protein [Streptococcus salivarius]